MVSHDFVVPGARRAMKVLTLLPRIAMHCRVAALRVLTARAHEIGCFYTFSQWLQDKASETRSNRIFGAPKRFGCFEYRAWPDQAVWNQCQV